MASCLLSAKHSKASAQHSKNLGRQSSYELDVVVNPLEHGNDSLKRDFRLTACLDSRPSLGPTTQASKQRAMNQRPNKTQTDGMP